MAFADIRVSGGDNYTYYTVRGKGLEGILAEAFKGASVAKHGVGDIDTVFLFSGGELKTEQIAALSARGLTVGEKQVNCPV